MTFEELFQQLKAGEVHVTIRHKHPTFLADWKQGWKQGEIGVTREQALQFIGWGAVDNAGLMVGPTVRRKPPFP